jgi:superfamily II DNA or RNA helicase
LRFHLNYRKGKNYFCCICNGSNINHYIQIEPPKINLEFYEWDNKFLNYGTVKITKIENIKNKSNNSHVYDIEVEDNHNFICSTVNGGTGPIVHNCHHIASRTFSTLFYTVQPKYLIGLSATPERKDGLSKVLYWFLGPQIIYIKRDTDKPSIQFIFNDTQGYTEKFNRLGKVNIPEMITDLSIKLERNCLIIEKVLKLVKENRKILILSERRSHCEYFCDQLKQNGITSGIYLGGMKTLDRETSTLCQVIVGTYQAAGEGFDVADLDTLILTTPKSDVQQAVGRILRQKNANEPLVIDIVDQFSIFKAQYYKRRKFYKASEFKLI